jgi:hypothetical protein
MIYLESYYAVLASKGRECRIESMKGINMLKIKRALDNPFNGFYYSFKNRITLS